MITARLQSFDERRSRNVINRASPASTKSRRAPSACVATSPGTMARQEVEYALRHRRASARTTGRDRSRVTATRRHTVIVMAPFIVMVPFINGMAIGVALGMVVFVLAVGIGVLLLIVRLTRRFVADGRRRWHEPAPRRAEIHAQAVSGMSVSAPALAPRQANRRMGRCRPGKGSRLDGASLGYSLVRSSQSPPRR
jgi:hypothetical protein